MNDIRRVLSYNDVLLCPRNSENEHLSDANLEVDYINYGRFAATAIPLINAPMDKVCTPELLTCLRNKFNMSVSIHRWFKSAEDQMAFFKECKFQRSNALVFLSVGYVGKWKTWIDHLLSEFPIHRFAFLVDMANGDTHSCVETVEYIKAKAPFANIMAGNVATKSGYRRLEAAGANFIRVGIGGGSVCTTRTNVGFGIPTLTSVIDCSTIKGESYLVADGGIEYPGDICKAMAAGADMVMAGKMFAGTSLSAGEKFDKDGEALSPGNYDIAQWVSYRGMASAAAANSLDSKKSHVSVEGVSGFVPYMGDTEEIVEGILGNLRSSLSYYAGVRDWKQFRRSVKFVEITHQGWGESLTRVKSKI